MKWIEMMVKKLTARYMNLNKQFKVQRHTIVCQSGMEDYVSVTIDCTESFSFDFWTKELTCEYGSRYFDDVSEAFRKVYGNITIINKTPIGTAIEFTTISLKLYPSLILSNAVPNTAQFVVIKGKYTPKALYKTGENFFITISTN